MMANKLAIVIVESFLLPSFRIDLSERKLAPFVYMGFAHKTG